MKRRVRSRLRQSVVSPETLELRALLSTITVTSLADTVADDGEVTLREAVLAANTDTSVDGSTAGDGADTIVFDASLSGQLQINSQLDITESVSIIGNGADTTIIRGIRKRDGFRLANAVNADLVVEKLRLVRMNRAIEHLGSGSVTVRDVRIRNGRQGIRAETDLTVENTEFFGNLYKSRSSRGAAIEAWFGTSRRLNVDIRDSTFINNRTDDSSAPGGAIYIWNSDVHIDSSLFTANRTLGSFSHGGAVYVTSTDTTITNSTFDNNSTRFDFGGAIYASHSDLTVESSTITDNNAGNSADRGGGLAYATSQARALVITNSLFAGNTFNDATAEDIYFAASNASRTVTNSFVASNRGSGLQSNNGNADADGNLIGNTSNPLDPELGPLQDNDGPTLTRMPDASSPVVDAGGPTDLRVDQRNRIRVAGASTDMGAVEIVDSVFRVTPARTLVNEGDASLTVTFDVELRTPIGAAFDAFVRSIDGTATAGSDYTTVNETLNFAGNLGEVQQFTATILDDSDFERREDFSFLFDTSLADNQEGFLAPTVRIDSDEVTGAGLIGSTLVISGDGADDVIDVSPDGDDLVATLNGSETTVTAADVTQIEIHTGDGENTVTIDAAITLPVEVHGGADADDITTGSGDDVIHAFGGNDVISAGAGRDEVHAGVGDDTADGGADRDTIFGAQGNDLLRGGDDVDRLFGQQGRDRLEGGPGADLLFGGGNQDLLLGEAGDDRLYGDTNTAFDDAPGADGKDIIHGGEDRDEIFGGTGRDQLNGGPGNDTITGHGILRGGDGNDRLIVPATVGTGSRLVGDADNDTLQGAGDDDTMIGGPGRDSLLGSGGDDILEGNGLADVLRGGSGNDHLDGGSKRDRISGEADDDMILGGDGADILDGGSGDDVVSGGEHGDQIVGGSGADILLGRDGDDRIFGGSHRDIIIGGVGADTLLGESDTDLIASGSTTLSTADLLTALSEWTADRDIEVRRQNLIDGTGSAERNNGSVFLTSGGATPNIVDDGEADDVTGGADRDWFFVNLADDTVDNDLF